MTTVGTSETGFHPVGSEVRYSCPPGQRLLGSEVRRCRTDGRWSGTVPDCQFHDCGLIPGENMDLRKKFIFTKYSFIEFF